MRSARILFAAAATAGTLALAAPGAYAITAGDWDGSAQSQESDHDKGDKSEKEHDKGGWEKDHDKPKGGMHTGSGALSLVNADDWTKDTEKDKQKDWTKDTEKDKQKEDGGYKPEKPKGGVHTGGGGLASSTTNVTGAALVAGGVAGFVLYRRRKAAGAAA